MRGRTMSKTEKYELLSGETIELPAPKGELAEFLERLAARRCRSDDD